MWFIAFFAFYMALSTAGCLFFKPDGTHFSYLEIVGDRNWFMYYSILLGLWVATIISKDYQEYLTKKDKIQKF